MIWGVFSKRISNQALVSEKERRLFFSCISVKLILVRGGGDLR